MGDVWGYLWHKLEIGLMRVGEHIGERPRKSWGVGLHFFQLQRRKMIGLLLNNEVRDYLEPHAINGIGHGTL